MNFSVHKLSGVTTILIPMESSTTITSQIFCHAGSVFETRETNGLSHFLEHMFFKGGVRYPDTQSIARVLDEVGAEHNAYTSDYFASYYVKSAPEYRSLGIDVLSDMICNATFPQDEVTKEMGVILQELQMYKDQPRHNMLMNAKTRYEGDNPYGWPIIGKEETIKAVTKESLHTHKNALYTKDNLFIVVAGHLQDQQGILDMIAQHFAHLPEHTSLHKAKYAPYKPSEHSSKLVQGVNQSHVAIFADGVRLSTYQHVAAANILANILGGTTSSKLWMEIREKLGLCYYVGASHSSGPDFGTFQISGGLDKKQLQLGLDAIYLITDGIAQGQIGNDEFELAKNNYLGSLQMGLETSDAVADRVGSRFIMRNEIKTLDEVIEQYRQVQIEDVMEICDKLKKENLYTYWIE